MKTGFTHTVLGNTGIEVHRLGLSSTYRPGTKAIHYALDQGLNYFFCYGFDSQMFKVMRDVMQTNREKYVIATGAYNLIFTHTNQRKTLEKRLRQLKTDYIDLYLFQGITKEKHFPDDVREELYQFKKEGKVRAIGISTHDRKFAGKLADEGLVDVLMVRYNAAHRGAEKDIFPYLKEHNPGIVSFTATRWRYLTHKPKGWAKDGRVPSAGMCYRFVLSNPNVHVCMTAPSNIQQLEHNINALENGPLDDDEMKFMKEFGDAVYNRKHWFM